MKACFQKAMAGCIAVLALLFAGCGAKTYTVSGDALLSGLGAYPKGAQVTLVLDIWATDTDYRFFVDGQPIQADFDGNRGYHIRFTMPDHDVSVTVETRNEQVVANACPVE